MEEEKVRRTKKDSSKKSSLFVVSSGIFKYSVIIQPRQIPLYINNVLLAIHIRFSTSDTNESTFCTHVDSCEVMNVVKFKLHK